MIHREHIRGDLAHKAAHMLDIGSVTDRRGNDIVRIEIYERQSARACLAQRIHRFAQSRKSLRAGLVREKISPTSWIRRQLVWRLARHRDNRLETVPFTESELLRNA